MTRVQIATLDETGKVPVDQLPAVANSNAAVPDYADLTVGADVAEGDLVYRNGVLYRRIAAGTISGSFTPANWMAVGAAPPQRVLIAPIQPDANTGWSTWSVDAAAPMGFTLTSASAQDNEATFNFNARAGTYTLEVLHKAGASRGIADVYIDGVLQGTKIDQYGASNVARRETIAGIVIPTDGDHTIRFVMATKNASSTGYVGTLSAISLRRTGA